MLEPLRADRIDFCVAAVEAVAHEADLMIDGVALWQFGLYVRADHPLADVDIKAEDLKPFPLASSRVPSWADLPHAGSIQQISWNGHVLCADSRTLKEIALKSDAVLLAMEPSVAADHADGLLKQLRYAPDLEWRTMVGIARRKGRPMTPAAEMLIAALESAICLYGCDMPSG